ncbi:hypothetical protein B296_00030063 [Ensete ventricosum]|uniref:Uncharacterized protein n=1 Tax=Ensete ventricosum TaxID=4639 RepID=A0A426Y1R5_ENSVE|nr:hypothetical protein B296_00030063 [Ensete ventricosum]
MHHLHRCHLCWCRGSRPCSRQLLHLLARVVPIGTAFSSKRPTGGYMAITDTALARRQFVQVTGALQAKSDGTCDILRNLFAYD